MKRSIKSVYDQQPGTVRYKGHLYVLAAGEGEEEGATEEEVPKKPKSTGAARVRINECKGNSVTFEIKAIVHSYDGTGIPGLENADQPIRRRNFKIKPIRKLNDVPKDVLQQIEADDNGDAVIKRIEKSLRVRPSPPLYYIDANGGWNWSKRNGDKEVAAIQGLLEFLRSRKAILFSYCNNKIDYGANPGLI